MNLKILGQADHSVAHSFDQLVKEPKESFRRGAGSLGQVIGILMRSTQGAFLTLKIGAPPNEFNHAAAVQTYYRRTETDSLNAKIKYFNPQLAHGTVLMSQIIVARI